MAGVIREDKRWDAQQRPNVTSKARGRVVIGWVGRTTAGECQVALAFTYFLCLLVCLYSDRQGDKRGLSGEQPKEEQARKGSRKEGQWLSDRPYSDHCIDCAPIHVGMLHTLVEETEIDERGCGLVTISFDWRALRVCDVLVDARSASYSQRWEGAKWRRVESVFIVLPASDRQAKIRLLRAIEHSEASINFVFELEEIELRGQVPWLDLECADMDSGLRVRLGAGLSSMYEAKRIQFVENKRRCQHNQGWRLQVTIRGK
ncbi:hypothetical protein CC1G_15825 [Coprinopsis cinerea okayama7|uniref:Uncharacterized protein n=1 Tax=Coprinopsis cinerea (strain Okayama-7 / 130 / ATCC MYA-4618 / FGSC 9003) TaxID=240176 RepID=D6RR27_COPC7|nr:hypothetical protein CC1G_15825 [Coprinopsis cinerea okayama7\|eukprot:XP_002910031.1 hypothetical protein CC1G_15825 [Coprinopsis cinerea okayama7\